MMQISSFSLLSFCLILIQCNLYIHSVAANDSAASFFNDPDIVQDWIFQMINIYPVWERGLNGTGIRVRINDEGVDSRHDEFEGRFDIENSCGIYDAYFDETTRNYRNHGTIVASIVGASGNNGQCAVGIAPGVTLSSCAVVGAPILDPSVFDHSYPKYNLEGMDISQNSLGYVPCVRPVLSGRQYTFPNTDSCPFVYRSENVFSYNGTELVNMRHPCDVCDFPLEQANDACSNAVALHCQFYFEYDQDACLAVMDQDIANGQCSFQSLRTIRDSIETGAREGRDGKGIIYVYAAGNEFMNGDNTNFENFGRFPILVGAVGKDGQHSSYSTAGSSVLCTAPAGDFDDVDRQTVARAGGGCMLSGDGTSFSSPIVSGIIALMLQVNPDLTWRDVQGILVSTSEAITHTLYQDDTQTTNGAGLTHSNLYGFGMANAFEAVTAAENWKNYGPEQMIVVQSPSLNLNIEDDAPLITQLDVSNSNPPMFMENVEVKLWLKHLSRGHLQIKLTSPDGTVSELVPGERPENGNTETEPWILRTVKNWGEEPQGTWTLTMEDTIRGDLSRCIDTPILIGPPANGFLFGCNALELGPVFHNQAFMDVALSLLNQGVAEGCCICSGNVFCQDTIDSALCYAAVQNGVCANGSLMPALKVLSAENANGLTIKEACCMFGGGTTFADTSFFRDMLVKWELHIYGHPDPTKTESPTLRPTTVPPTTVAPPATSGSGSIWTTTLTTLGLIVVVGGVIVML